jgi:hypothetical protein
MVRGHSLVQDARSPAVGNRVMSRPISAQDQLGATRANAPDLLPHIRLRLMRLCDRGGDPSCNFDPT